MSYNQRYSTELSVHIESKVEINSTSRYKLKSSDGKNKCRLRRYFECYNASEQCAKLFSD